MTARMYVITHKLAKIPDIQGYVPILVGAMNHSEIQEYSVRDDEGENISSRNSSYCELTGVYWIWKNDDTDIIGISHYRRFFSNSEYLGHFSNFIKCDEIIEVMNNKRIILPKLKSYATSVLQGVNIAPNINDIREIYQALIICAPDYLGDFEKYLLQNKSYLFNMFIMRRKDFNNYCTWLFKILDYIESHHDMEAETNEYRKRLYGFLSERLLYVWVHHNFSKHEIETLPVINIEENDFFRLRHKIGNIKNEFAYRIKKGTKNNKAKDMRRMDFVKETKD